MILLMVTLLSDILDSKRPADLLAFLLVAPLRSFSAKELATRLRTTSGNAANAAKVLERNHIVKAFIRHQVKFFILNLRHPQVTALRDRCLAEQGAWPDELFASLKKLGQLTGIYLSGLFVGRPELPVDLLLVGKVSSTKLNQFLEIAQKLIGSELNYSVMSQEEFDIRRHTFDRFIKDIFDYPHVIVVEKVQKQKPNTTLKALGLATPKKVAKKNLRKSKMK